MAQLARASASCSRRCRAKLSNGSEADPLLPEHCLLRGRIDERTGADGLPQHTGFELRLPSAFAGRFFCQGGPATDGFDGLSALVQWVEQGQAPERVLAQGSGTLPASVSRPLCPWPQEARYSGGDVHAAASFACR